MPRKAAAEAVPATGAPVEKKKTGITKPMKLSADLAAIVGTTEASRGTCIKELWAYLKKNNLQDPANKQYFTPDKKMAKVFGTEKIRGFGMAKFLGAHLSDV
jgi:upstream activation factor subunit UAF30